MIPYRTIEKKRDGGELSASELGEFLAAYLEGRLPDYQMSALLMAVYFQGLSPAELEALVSGMVASGASLDLSHLPGPRVDKHSTGGVGDKVSLVLAPLAAELGIYVPMMSGRGLGHSGGTLDKLEAIPGFRTDLALDSFLRVLEAERFAMIGQTAEIAPLDRRLYDLRSVTGTVPSIPLISGSIMSKKLAEGLTGLVLDVKTGRGAFIQETERALDLARTMVGIGSRRGVETVALLTDMDRPLGRAAGNALETREALECLAGGGPPDLRDVTLALVAEMLVVARLATDREEARERAARELAGGRPLERFARVVALQGGNPRVVSDPGLLPEAPVVESWHAPREGVVVDVDPLALGYGVVELGGGRTRLGDDIDPSVGFRMAVTTGDLVVEGQLLATVHARDADGARRGLEIVAGAVRVGQEPPVSHPLVSHRVTSSGVESLAGG